MQTLRGKVVITGGAGFIGSHIAETFVQEYECDVVVLDDLSTGKKENLSNIYDEITFVEGSITDYALVHETCAGAVYVIHQAAIASVPQSIEDPRKAHEVNVTGTLNVFEAARQQGVTRVVYTSSSAVYGDTATMPITDATERNPLSPYALHKAMGEQYGKLYSDLYGLETVGLCYFNVFGPRQDPDSPYAAVIPLFAKCMREGKQPTIFGDGDTTSRDYVYVSDVVQANVAACLIEGISGQVYNIGAGHQITPNELMNVLNSELGTDIQPRYVPLRESEVRQSVADITQAQQTLGYTPDVSFKAGIQHTLMS